MIRRLPSKQPNAIVAHSRDKNPIARFASLLLCGLVLAGGFVYAGGKHFASLRLGYQTEKLRVALDNAREEQRHLLLEREAGQLGMQPLQPAQIDPLKQIEVKETRIAANEKPEQMKTTKVEAKPKSN